MKLQQKEVKKGGVLTEKELLSMSNRKNNHSKFDPHKVPDAIIYQQYLNKRKEIAIQQPTTKVVGLRSPSRERNQVE